MPPLEFSVGGEMLRGDLHLPPRTPRAGAPLVVLSHGLSSCRLEWFDFPQRLAAHGYAVFAFDYRGHGESGGERGVQSIPRAREDLAAAVEAARRPGVDADRLGLLGHSLGATLALHAAPDLPVRCVVALAPPWKLRREMGRFEFAAYNVLRVVNAFVRLLYRPGLRVPYKVDYARLYDSLEAIERARVHPFLQKTIPIKNYRPLVRELDGVAAARRVQVPTLVLAAEHDRVVRNESTRRVYGALAGPKQFLAVPASGHSMCGDQSRDVVLAGCRTFLDKHLAGARP